jgi:hypothetical protein
MSGGPRSEGRNAKSEIAELMILSSDDSVSLRPTDRIIKLQHRELWNRFDGFLGAGETVETVAICFRSAGTALKQGGNETWPTSSAPVLC